MARKIPGGAIQANTITVTQLQTTVVTQIQSGASGGPKISAITYPNSATAVANTGNDSIVLTGTGFESGVTVVVNGNAVPSVTRTNANSLSFTTPALSSTTYPVYVVNPDGGTAIFINPGLRVSGKPVWSTSSPLTAWSKSSALSRTLVATSDSAVTYSLAGGSSLPSGIALAANGLLSGTLTSPPANTTTYNFTVVATDAENQTTSSAFSINALASIQFNISPSVNGTSTWDTAINGPLTIDTTGTYEITPLGDMNANVVMWGAGGGGAYSDFATGKGNGGGGGCTTGFVKMYANTVYTIRVGAHGRGANTTNTNFYRAAAGGGGSSTWDGNWSTGGGGAYTGIFAGAETFANSVMIAGGGGGGGVTRNSSSAATGGGGGGTTGAAGWFVGTEGASQAGGGGTQSAAGVQSNPSGYGSLVAAGQLLGGQVGTNGAGIGAGGGSGYYGGAAGIYSGDNVGGGGGGSGFAHPSLTVGATLTQATRWYAAGNTNPYYANTVGFGGQGVASSSPHSASFGGNGRFVLIDVLPL